MRLRKFRIKNYKSIQDSGLCFMPDDNVMTIAGQNEAGKSAVLEGLRAFDIKELNRDAISLVEGELHYPEIYCSFSCEADDVVRIKEYFEEAKLDPPGTLLDNWLKNGIDIVKKYTSATDFYYYFVNGSEKLERFDLKFNDEDKDVAETKLTAYLEKVARCVWRAAPSFLYFDEMRSILPSSIKIADLTEENEEALGYDAVRSVEKILGIKLADLAEIGDGLRHTRQDKYSKEFTADFTEYWKQRVDGDEKVTVVVKYEQGGPKTAPYINFYIKSGENHLKPIQRSRGFQWFLSFYIELRANRDTAGHAAIVLFDEPGLYLHAKAQGDISCLFEDVAKSNQIIYSTHSPYLIDPEKLHRIRLVLNVPSCGSVIEKITTNRSGPFLEALKPLRDALGLEACLLSSCTGRNNVICEGISDFYYLTAFKSLLRRSGDYYFLPSTGVSNVHLLAELCIGWGLNWVCLLDADKAGVKELKRMTKAYGLAGSEVSWHFITHDLMCIEDAFNPENYIALMGLDTPPQPMLDLVAANGGKELLARLFLSRVKSGDVVLKMVDAKTVEAFSLLFDAIEKRYGVEIK